MGDYGKGKGGREGSQAGWDGRDRRGVGGVVKIRRDDGGGRVAGSWFGGDALGTLPTGHTRNRGLTMSFHKLLDG